MKIKLKNLGVLKQAEFELGDLTIICGNNNTGKTYATYALFGFLDSWKKRIVFTIPDAIIDQLISEGSISLNLLDYLTSYPEALAKACQDYSKNQSNIFDPKNLSNIFAASVDKFKEADFQIELLINESDVVGKNYESRIRSSGSITGIFAIQKSTESPDLIITILTEKTSINIQGEIIKEFINRAIIEIIFGDCFPDTFIASAERTGTAIFRKGLNFAYDRMLKELSISKVEKEIDPFELLFKNYQNYPLPINVNIDFMSRLDSIAKQKSQLSEDSPNF
ncbi:MAG: AAA family ATPase, partial [Snowella sp.]